MRWLSRLLVVLIVSLIAIALPAVPAQAQCGGPFIELSPKSGAPGTEVIVTGQRFRADTLVDIYYAGTREDDRVATGRTGPSGDFAINFTIPEGYAGYYELRAYVHPDTVDTYFTVKPGLTVSPERGPVGTNITVEGRGFARNEQGIELGYYVNGNYETVGSNFTANARGSWETKLQIPFSARGEHKLDAEGIESRLYEVEDAIFTVTAEISIDKSSGIVGDKITMTASRFAPNEQATKILFDGEAAATDIKVNSKGEWEASFEVPELPSGQHTVTAEGQRTRKEDLGDLSFEIESSIMLSPDKGHVGMNLTVIGRGFAADEDVDIMYDGTQTATTETNDKGSFQVSFPAPESKYGEQRVAAGYSGGNAASAIFTMESDPPDTPTPISPANGNRLGFMSAVTPTLEWSEVSDDSGVDYSLQIATTADVTATGEFADPMVSEEGLAGMNYTLDKPLSYGTYYWIVQAVDGADNESGWSGAYSFRVGLLPLWGFVIIIVAAVALLALLVRALIRRRTIYYDRW